MSTYIKRHRNSTQRSHNMSPKNRYRATPKTNIKTKQQRRSEKQATSSKVAKYERKKKKQ